MTSTSVESRGEVGMSERDRMFTLYVRVQDVAGRDADVLVREVREKLQSVLEPDAAIRDYTFSPVFCAVRPRP